MKVLPESHSGPRGRAGVLESLKREGPISADALAARLGVTSMAVRQHLARLEADGLATVAQPAAARAKGRGRPVTLWRAAESADARFPDSHALLAADLIGQMKKAFGDEGLDRLLTLRTKDQELLYRAETGKAKTLKGKLEALARIREREGYMPAVRRDPETGGFLFVENHCPVCVAAKLCQGLCREELVLFRRVLGDGAVVERTSHILAGASRCAYRVVAA